jgi:hypothetical protein
LFVFWWINLKKKEELKIFSHGKKFIHLLLL